MSEKNYITPKGFEKLRSELDHLLKVERPEVTKTVAWAASNGDRSENADYQYGKKRLREIDRRIRFLTSRIEKAEVIDPVKSRGLKRIQFAATVTVENPEGEERVYVIVGVDEINTKSGLISWKSPIGRALLGKSIDDEIVVKTPTKELEYTITNIQYLEINEVGESEEYDDFSAEGEES